MGSIIILLEESFDLIMKPFYALNYVPAKIELISYFCYMLTARMLMARTWCWHAFLISVVSTV